MAVVLNFQNLMRKMLLFPLFDKLRQSGFRDLSKVLITGAGAKILALTSFLQPERQFSPKNNWTERGRGLTAHGSTAAGDWGREVMRTQCDQRVALGAVPGVPPSETTPSLSLSTSLQLPE